MAPDFELPGSAGSVFVTAVLTDRGITEQVYELGGGQGVEGHGRGRVQVEASGHDGHVRSAAFGFVVNRPLRASSADSAVTNFQPASAIRRSSS